MNKTHKGIVPVLASASILSLALAFSLSANDVMAADNSNGFCQSASCEDDFKQLERLAHYGSGEAATIVAVAYATGDGVEQNTRKARRHISMAAKWREPMGMHQLSVWLREGFIYEQDIERADMLLDQAVKANFPPALTDKAKILLAQNSSETDKEAISLLELANEQYYSPARYLLAQLLASGVAVEADLARAGSLYKNLALKGYADSRQRLDEIIQSLEQYVKPAAQTPVNEELMALLQPVLADLKQFDNLEIIKVAGQKFNVNSELSNIVTQLNSLNMYTSRHSTGSRIPGNLCGRGVSRCDNVYDDTQGGLLDRSSVFTFNVSQFRSD